MHVNLKKIDDKYKYMYKKYQYKFNIFTKIDRDLASQLLKSVT